MNKKQSQIEEPKAASNEVGKDFGATSLEEQALHDQIMQGAEIIMKQDFEALRALAKN
jgi:hypothetical protein